MQDLNKWKSKSDGSLKLTSESKDTLCFTLGSQEFKISIPEDYPKCETGMLFVDITDIKLGYNWMSHLNTYICDKNPSLFKLLCYIEKENKKNLKIDIDTFTKIDDLVSQFDIDELMLRKKLESNLKNMKSSLPVGVDAAKAPVLFSDNVPGNILIKEYLDCARRFKGTNRIEVELNGDNVYSWKLKFTAFKNNKLTESLTQLNTKYNYSYIELEVLFHDKLYPAYPPFVRVVRPRLTGSLMHKITNLKVIQMEYWSPSRDMKTVIDKLYTIFDEHISIDVDSDMNNIAKFPAGAYHPLESTLAKLASFCDIKDDNSEPLDKTEYKKLYTLDKSAAKMKQPVAPAPTYPTNHGAGTWKKGTGYGTGGSKDWSIEEHVRLQKERDVQVQSILQAVITTVQTTPSNSINTITKILASSYIIPFIKTYLADTTIMEISKHRDIFRLIFTLLQNFANEDGIMLFVDTTSKPLYNILLDINKDAQQFLKFAGKTATATDTEEMDMDLIQMIVTLCEMLTPCYFEYIKKMAQFLEEKKAREKKFETKKDDKKEDLTVTKYREGLEPLKFDMAKLANFKFPSSGYYGSKATPTPVGPTVMRRMAKEFSMFNKSLPVHYGSSILARVDDTNNRCIRCLITGPDDTPYDSGVFIFDVYITDEYPNGPPYMIFLNHGGKRFNPNLYNCGKVCLSLLGTWRGTASEGWNKETSTLYQLFVSVQAQILIDHPYFNEPGHESYYGTSQGIQTSKVYNNHIRYFTMCHAVYDLLATTQAYPEFREAIKKHFALKKDYILKTYKKWVDESFDSTQTAQHHEHVTRAAYESKFNQIKEILNKL
jgi:baculoviral IAP repeat-containing protein 6 (apollon)